MKRLSLLMVSVGLSLSSVAHADLKVLFKFDSTGVEANRVIQIEASGENYPASLSNMAFSSSPDVVIMKWVDTDGKPLAISRIPDPRVATSPEHMNPSLRSRVGLDGGAWVGDGPDGTETVIVEFPENVALGLQAETWSVSLRKDE